MNKGRICGLGFDQVVPKAEESAETGQGEQGEDQQANIFGDFVTDQDHSSATAAIKLDGAKGDALKTVDGDGASQDDGREKNEHDQHDKCCASNGDARDQKQPTKYLEPRQTSGNRIKQERLVDDVVLTEEF